MSGLLLFFGFLLGVWLHSIGHYLYANKILKYTCRLDLGMSFRNDTDRAEGIYFGWFPLPSRFRLFANRAPHSSGKVRLKVSSVYLFGILFSLILCYLFGTVGFPTSSGIVEEKTSLSTEERAVVGKVAPNSPAEIAGIQSQALKFSWQMIPSSIENFIHSLHQPQTISGPLQISLQSSKDVRLSSLFFFILAGACLSLAIWNLIPLPPFDLGNALFRGLFAFPENRLANLRILGILVGVIIITWGFLRTGWNQIIVQ